MIRQGTSLACLFLLTASIFAACSISGDKDDPLPTAIDATLPEGTPVEPGEPTQPITTETPEPTSTATVTLEPTATATSTATATPTPTATSTPSPTPIPIVENPFANLSSPDTVLENYTVNYNAEFLAADSTTETLEIFIEQSAPSRYHLRSGAEVELWVIGTETYFRDPADGTIFLVPSAIDPGLVSPAAYLIQVPDPANIPEALAMGQESVDGRSATFYTVSVEQLGELGLASEEISIMDPEGTIEVWIDEELNFISQMKFDVEWTDENGSRQMAIIELLVSNVGDTPEIASPL